MSKYDWEFIKPLDQSSAIANLAIGNKQITDGLQGMADSVTGLSDAYKQRNTDEILNTLYAAQSSADLPAAMNAVQALQAQYGRGFDQSKVREAIDTRGSTLSQRDLQAINLQQAQRAQAAIPQVNEMAATFAAGRKGVTPEMAAQLQQAAGMGIDVSSLINNLANTAQGDFTTERSFTTGRSDRAEDVQWRKSQADQAQNNWQADFDARQDNTNWNRAGDLSKENPASFGYGTDANGNPVTVSNPGINRMDAYGALSGVRGIRNNNPGNLGFAGQKGASRENGSGRFAAFNTPEEGLAAMSKQLDLFYTGKSKNVKGPAQSVSAIISAWAPPGENNTKAYIAQVAKELNVSPTAKLNLNDPNTKMALMQAIVKKENGGNPYTLEQYQAGVTGRIGTASQAVANVGGGVVSQANMSKVSSGYQNAIAKLSADFEAETVKSQTKGSLAATGKSLETWASTKKDNGIVFAGNNSWFTSASDLVGMAKKDPTFKKLPETAQMNILEGAYAKMNDVNKLQYVPDGDLQKFISNEAKSYHTNRKAAFTQAKEAAFESAYQGMVQQYQAIGAAPPSREGARQLLDPTYKPKAQAKPTAQPVQEKAKPTTTAKAVAAVTPTPSRESSVKKVDTSKMDKAMAERAKRKQAAIDAVNAKAKAQAKEKRNILSVPAKPLLANTSTMTPQQINDLMKKYNVR